MIRIGEVAKLIGRTPRSIKHWYSWEEEFGVSPILGKLPPVYRIGPRGDRYFEIEDIHLLIKFRDNLKLHPGLMGEFNRRNKGELGKLQQERAEFREVLNSFK